MTMDQSSRARTVVYTTAALVAFASNSVLCRLALGRGSIDAATFSTVRLAAGAVTLVAITRAVSNTSAPATTSWRSACLLFLYAIPFSFAYVSLSAGTGALILFGAVQGTLMVAAVWQGSRPHLVQWVGLILALGGLVCLVLPGVAAPAWSGALLMTVAGVSWGLYTLQGRSSAEPLAQTTSNFVRAVPMALAVSLLAQPRFHVEPRGVAFAVLSGSLSSGVGYLVWYAALRRLTVFRAAILQLPVPVLAATGGVIFLAESISVRLLVASLLVLGGIALALVGRGGVTRPKA